MDVQTSLAQKLCARKNPNEIMERFNFSLIDDQDELRSQNASHSLN